MSQITEARRVQPDATWPIHYRLERLFAAGGILAMPLIISIYSSGL